MALHGLSLGERQEFSLECLSLSDNRGEPRIQKKPIKSVSAILPAFCLVQHSGEGTRTETYSDWSSTAESQTT